MSSTEFDPEGLAAKQLLDALGPTTDVVTAGRILGCGRTLAYRLATRGEMPGLLHLGGKLRVSTAALRRFVEAKQ